MKRLVLFNKPRGVLSAKKRDPSSPWLPTVTEVLAAAGLRSPSGISPVGRLDAESEGLLLLTDDGKLASRMMDPQYGCRKSYLAVTRGYGRPGSRVRCSTELCTSCVAEGVQLRSNSAKPYCARPVEMAQLGYEAAANELGGGGSLWRCLDGLVDLQQTPGASLPAAVEAAELDFVRVILTEGKKHEVRLLLRSASLATLRLVRIAHGPLRDPQLLTRPGSWRELCAEERRLLQRGDTTEWAVAEHNTLPVVAMVYRASSPDVLAASSSDT